MGYNFTKPLTVNGTLNLLALLTAAGYQGSAILELGGTLQNMDALVDAYLHFTDSNVLLPGTRQVESTPIVGTITGAGNATFTITGAGMNGSPKAVSVPVTVGMTGLQVCRGAALTTLSGDIDVSTFADVSCNGAVLILTKKLVAANDATMNIAYTNGTCTGLTPDATSDDTTAGALNTTNGMPFGSGTAPSAVWNLPRGTDLSTIWIHTASSITVNAAIQS